MKIEVGKKYINAEGGIISIAAKDNIPFYMFRGNDEQSYDENGMFNTLMKTNSDLICEVVPEIGEQYMSGSITNKEFIEKHIEHWSRVNAQ